MLYKNVFLPSINLCSLLDTEITECLSLCLGLRDFKENSNLRVALYIDRLDLSVHVMFCIISWIQLEAGYSMSVRRIPTQITGWSPHNICSTLKTETPTTRSSSSSTGSVSRHLTRGETECAGVFWGSGFTHTTCRIRMN